jgi:hypothetical protein
MKAMDKAEEVEKNKEKEKDNDDNVMDLMSVDKAVDENVNSITNLENNDKRHQQLAPTPSTTTSTSLVGPTSSNLNHNNPSPRHIDSTPTHVEFTSTYSPLSSHKDPVPTSVNHITVDPNAFRLFRTSRWHHYGPAKVAHLHLS